jgi:leader peptidase (prepilin peptidase)/N-methyltransferase
VPATIEVTIALVLLAAKASAWEGLSTMEQVRLIGLQVIAVAYVFTLGATLGSFLNVVIYRLPRGMDIVRPRSRCPACRTPIAFWDNIPVLSWLVLRGKCRTCLSPISLRYPLVEAAVGGMVALLFWLEVRWGGVNLPLRKPEPMDMILYWRISWANVLMAVYQIWLLATLLAMAFIQSDRQRVPWSIVRLGLVAGLLLPLAWPGLRPLPALPGLESLAHRAWWHGLVDGLLGAGLGWLTGSLLALMLRRSCLRRGGREGMAGAMMLVGAFLGWQAALDIGLCCAAALALVRIAAAVYPRVLAIPPLAVVAIVSWLYVPLWKQLWLVGRVLDF